MNNITHCQFTIIAHDRLGVLERILRVIRHRGGRLQSMKMQVAANNTLNLSLTLVTEKSVAALQSQIAKLVDVIVIENS